MAKFKITLNMEFCRSADKGFEAGAKIAAERGQVTGTPVGCACGEGVVDWKRVLKIMEPVDREIFLSVECGTIDQAARSLTFLKGLLP